MSKPLLCAESLGITGVSQAAPYSHFRDKNDLISAVCLEGTKWFGEYMRREAVGKEGSDYLAGLAIGHIRFGLEHRALFRLMSTTDISEATADIADAPEVLTEGYLMMANALAVSPLSRILVQSSSSLIFLWLGGRFMA